MDTGELEYSITKSLERRLVEHLNPRVEHCARSQWPDSQAPDMILVLVWKDHDAASSSRRGAEEGEMCFAEAWTPESIDGMCCGMCLARKLACRCHLGGYLFQGSKGRITEMPSCSFPAGDEDTC
jgi:hypothetical protein